MHAYYTHVALAPETFTDQGCFRYGVGCDSLTAMNPQGQHPDVTLKPTAKATHLVWPFNDDDMDPDLPRFLILLVVPHLSDWGRSRRKKSRIAVEPTAIPRDFFLRSNLMSTKKTDLCLQRCNLILNFCTESLASGELLGRTLDSSSSIRITWSVEERNGILDVGCQCSIQKAIRLPRYSRRFVRRTRIGQNILV